MQNCWALRHARRSSAGDRRLEEIGIGRADKTAHVEQIGDALLNHGRTQQAIALGGLLRHDGFFDDVEDAIDDETDAAALLGVDDDLQRGGEIALAVSVGAAMAAAARRADRRRAAAA